MDVVVVVVVIALLQYPGTVHPSCLPFDSLLPSVFFMFHVYTKYSELLPVGAGVGASCGILWRPEMSCGSELLPL